MKKINICMTAAVLLFAATFPAEAADRRYPIAYVQKVEVTNPSRRTAWEDKDFLDCDDVVLTEEDVRYALRHMRKVPWKVYDPENTDTTGCQGSALVTFKNGRILAMGIEPTGRITTAEYDAGMKITASPAGFYECDPCRERKMKFLKGALYRADERRLKKLEAEGRIPPGEAERRLKTLRTSR
ncbi:hypothetical protein ABL840_16625 [Variovorax sp. NFACC27]|uniref:hypothetical protein n=1 Tax=unclassified Variovorax TaxID=663243 RepID=UPI000896B482|nr:hypothetical protein SAMN03159371_03139 [Variovorax sp. NFACC28]SEG72460.1 hypothetical protein SAMN03159365_03386 [Variovorax sp. NFACC29]SFC77946.1 hypothetical protein SAMN03159379_03108 [Variovorax sp. NFACC26]SFG00611.1 hypothetical protein SAMN03159447_01383 [Variovorax sp. NFACC27]